MKYKLDEAIKVYYRATGGESGITDLQFITTNPSGTDIATVPLTAVSGHSGLYEGSFTPDAYGRWWIRVKSTTNPENKYAESYLVGEVETINPFPGSSFSSYLLNGSSHEMAVDGSVTPVELIASPPSGKIWYIHSVTIVIEDGAMNFNKYGGLSALTNGVDFLLKSNGIAERNIANVARNGDYYQFVDQLIFDSSTTDILVGKILLPLNYGTTHKLTYSNTEYIKTVVNDNLTGLSTHYVVIRGYEVDE